MLHLTQAVTGPGFVNGALASGSPLVVGMAGAPLPCTVSLTSTAVGRLIEISTDGGTTYFTPTFDTSVTNLINVVILAPVSHVRLTGATNDIWSVR